jgi:hypothetical protein
MSLLRTARKVAVASAVHGRVQQRQAQRFAATSAPAPGAPAPSVPARPATPGPVDAIDPAQRIALLVQLGELRDAGLLTSDEFEAQKAALLA